MKFWAKSGAPKSPILENPKETQGLLSKFSEKVVTKISENTVDKITKRVEQVQNHAQDLTVLFIFVIVGVVLIFGAMCYLPLLVLFPQKFSGLFSLGSMCILAGVASYKGWKGFLSSNFTGPNRYYSILYLGCLIGNLYCTLTGKSYLIILVLCVLQLIALAYYVASAVPGGLSAMSYVSSFAKTICKVPLSWISGDKGKGSMLPF
eukprot:TRINITY_DN997_c0_g1_i5.p1 TRINITY_DN997_c0_g1~~TRINITY_DN997_c0_g1_i5.p1  ORF type:complete len:206 (-),score=40.55 TRINITY_DN997_c0_g1_i5:964-1581(-)